MAIEIPLTPGFPEESKDALRRAASQCAVEKHLEAPPQMDVRTVVTKPCRRTQVEAQESGGKRND